MGIPPRAAPSSGAAIAGSGIYLGAGTSVSTIDGKEVPPQATGVWGFTDLLSRWPSWIAARTVPAEDADFGLVRHC
jgi:hypothetical protein